MIQAFPIHEFGGLDVLNDPQELGTKGAINLLNVDFDKIGRIRTRNGSSLLSTTATSTAIIAASYYKTAGGVEYIIAGELGGSVYPFNLSTGVVGTTSALPITGGNNSFARFGDPTNTRLYIASVGNLIRFDGAVYTVIATPINAPYLVEVTANDNRLVVATSLVDCTIAFSGAGTPETFGANDYVQLWPGDGEVLTALVRWRDLLFAFKQTKFAVFYGTSVSGTGTPIFNYRAVAAGQGANIGAAVAGDDGLYFANNSGIFVTTGGEPVCISRSLDPWVLTGTSGSLPTLSMANLTLAYSARSLYVTDRTNRTTLVYNTTLREWSVWQIGAVSVASVPTSSSFTGLYFGDNATKKIAKLDPSVTTDNGVAIAASYQSGFYELSLGNKATTRWTKLWGSGSPTFDIYTDHATSDPLTRGGTVALGTSPAISSSTHNKSYKGELFSHKLSSTSGAWSVNRIQHDVAETSKP